MRVGFHEARQAWASREQAACPKCGSDEFRPSRRLYSGLWSRFFRVRLVRCVKCGTRFPSASTRFTWTAVEGLPFMPVEVDEAPDWYPNEPRPPRELPVAQYLPLSNICPICRSTSIRPVPVPMSASRLFQVSVSYRCGRCNGAFSRISFTRVAVRAILFVVVIGGILFVGTSKLRTRRSETAPHVNQGQIPKPPPPVLR